MGFSSTRRRAAFAARLGTATAVCAAAMSAQSFLNPLTTTGVSQNGFRVYSVSAFTSYATVDNAWRNVVQSATGTTLNNFPSYSTLNGISASMGYRISGEDSRTNLSILYSPSFSYAVYGQGWSTMTHSLALDFDRKLARRWHAFAAVSGFLGNFNQAVFSPNSAQNLAALPGTIGQLATAAAGVPVAGPDTTVTSAAVTPQQRLFYGSQMLSANATLGVSYSYSTRLNLSAAINGNRMQHIGQSNGSAYQNYYLLPANTNVSGTLSVGYSLSQRTAISGSVSYARILSGFKEALYTGQFGVSRTLNRHWFVQLSGGGGYILPVSNLSISVRGKQYAAGAGLGYHIHDQTFVASIDRAVTDYYGMGAAAILSSGGGWNWQRRGSHWALQAGVWQDRLLGHQFAAPGSGNNGFRGTGGVSWRPLGHTSVSLEYAYLSFTGLVYSQLPTGQPLHFVQHSVQLSLGWAGTAHRGMSTGIAAR